MADRDLKDYYMRRLGEMKTERQSFINHWSDISEFVKPRKGRFFVQDRNRGEVKYNSIINSVGTQALKIATSGMLAGTISPTRPWFTLETHDPDMMEGPGVKAWLHKVERLLMTIFNESNFYGMSSVKLAELLLFGTSAMSHVDDFDSVARFYTHTIGSYLIDTNARFEPDTLAREFEWTASKMAQAFGVENLSTSVKTAIDKGNYGQWFPIVHFIEPNEDFRMDAPFAKNMPYRSVYYEPGNRGDETHKWLNRSGFHEFPVYITRWDVTGEDIYGTDSPGMIALGDIKHLQIEERRKAQAIDKMVNPPLGGPPGLRNIPINSLPGGVNVYDSTGTQELKPLYQVNPQLGELRADIAAVEQRINKAFFVDMFLAITNIEGIQPRNELDLLQRNEERLLQLGPVLERIQNEFLNKLIERTFNQCVRANILPTPPESLQGSPLRVRYISTLVMAQRAVATQSIDRLVAFAAGLASSGWVGAIEKLDAEQAVDEYAQAVGVPPSIIVPDEIILQRRAEQQRLQQAQAMLEGAQDLANAAKMASDAKTDEKNLLTDVLGQ